MQALVVSLVFILLPLAASSILVFSSVGHVLESDETDQAAVATR